MANVLSTVWTNVRNALTAFEGVLVTALSLQTLVVNFVLANVPAEQKLTSDIFAGAAFLLAVIKVVLADNAASKR
jgi:hypothetical protein